MKKLVYLNKVQNSDCYDLCFYDQQQTGARHLTFSARVTSFQLKGIFMGMKANGLIDEGVAFQALSNSRMPFSKDVDIDKNYNR